MCLLSDGIMRPVHLESVDDAFKVKGITTSVFVISPMDMMSSMENEMNMMYNQGYHGMINRTAPSGIPLYVSKPHFLDVDPDIVATVTGLTPDPVKHETSLYNVLLLGVTIKGNERLQFTIGFDHDATGSSYQNITYGQLFPMFWVERDTELSDANADELKSVLDGVSLITLLSIIIGTGVGGFLIMVGCCCLLAHKRSGSRAKIVPVDAEMDQKSK